MSKLLINWEQDEINKHNKLLQTLLLLNNSKIIFQNNPKISFYINKFIVENYSKFDIIEKDFIKYLFVNDKNYNMKYQAIDKLLKKFFNESLFHIFSEYNSLKIGEELCINVHYKNNIIHMFLGKNPLTSIFNLDNLKLKPFNYKIIEIKIIEHLFDFIYNKIIDNNNWVIKLWNLYFFSQNYYKYKIGMALDVKFLQKLNENLNKEKLTTNSTNYNIIIENLIKNSS